MDSGHFGQLSLNGGLSFDLFPYIPIRYSGAGLQPH
jgi:hypothetical protein